jgi:SOS-response transcriptional repressor LexA
MLSVCQEKVSKEIEKYMEANKIAPTVRELADLVGLSSTSTVQGHLNRLKKMGYIKRNPTCPRSLVILKAVGPTAEIPVKELRRIKELLEALGI